MRHARQHKRRPRQLVCTCCGAPVYESPHSPGVFFHDIQPRYLATKAAGARESDVILLDTWQGKGDEQ